MTKSSQTLNWTLATVLVISFVQYLQLNNATTDLHFLKTSFDDLIPLVPVFVIPYLLYFPILIGSLIYFFVKRPRLFTKVALAFIILNVAAGLTFIWAQTHIVRPDLMGTDPLTGLIKFIYSIDNPYNAWPSLHTAHTILLILFWFAVSKRTGLIMILAGLPITAATVLIKQHYAVDILGGLLYATISYYLASRLLPIIRAS